MGTRSRDPRDAEIARRVRAMRLQRGLSQTELGSALGVTFQQVQKYERGTNRISAGRLYRIAEALDAPIPFFCAGHEEPRGEAGPSPGDVESGFLQTSSAMRLIRAYSRIADQDIRLTLLRLTESLAAVNPPRPPITRASRHAGPRAPGMLAAEAVTAPAAIGAGARRSVRASPP